LQVVARAVLTDLLLVVTGIRRRVSLCRYMRTWPCRSAMRWWPVNQL